MWQVFQSSISTLYTREIIHVLNMCQGLQLFIRTTYSHELERHPKTENYVAQSSTFQFFFRTQDIHVGNKPYKYEMCDKIFKM